jgi:hypothetical protein
MADIDVVKKGSHLWLWIVLAIVIALILWYVVAGSSARSAQTGMLLDGGGQVGQLAAQLQPQV